MTAPDGAGVVTGGAFGPEGGLVALAGLAVGAALLGWLGRRWTGGLAVAERIAQPDLLPGNRADR